MNYMTLLEAMKWEIVNGERYPRGELADQWLHVQDACSRGTITPAEAYDAIRLGYVPEHLKMRESEYDHLF